MLRIENLRAGNLPPLSFAVADGECLAIEGPSGAGKTRLLRAIADLDEAGGYLTHKGGRRGEMPASEWRRKVRYAAAEPAWWTDTAGAVFNGDKLLLERARKLAGDLGLDSTILDRPIAQLSTGERQRLALARAMADQPRVLLLDEPTGALDPVSAALAEELIRYQALAGRSVILVSHDAAQVHRLADARLQLGPTAPGPARHSKGSDA